MRISLRIALEIQQVLDPEARRFRRRLLLSRLLTRVQFRQPAGGWTDYHMAIVDTGAPYSLIPLSLQPALQIERVGEMPIRGIIPGSAAEMAAVLAKVSARLLDAKRTSPHLSLWAMLAKTDGVPLILGWSGCLDRATLTLDAPRHLAWLAF